MSAHGDDGSRSGCAQSDAVVTAPSRSVLALYCPPLPLIAPAAGRAARQRRPSNLRSRPRLQPAAVSACGAADRAVATTTTGPADTCAVGVPPAAAVAAEAVQADNQCRRTEPANGRCCRSTRDASADACRRRGHARRDSHGQPERHASPTRSRSRLPRCRSQSLRPPSATTPAASSALPVAVSARDAGARCRPRCRQAQRHVTRPPLHLERLRKLQPSAPQRESGRARKNAPAPRSRARAGRPSSRAEACADLERGVLFEAERLNRLDVAVGRMLSCNSPHVRGRNLSAPTRRCGPRRRTRPPSAAASPTDCRGRIAALSPAARPGRSCSRAS